MKCIGNYWYFIHKLILGEDGCTSRGTGSDKYRIKPFLVLGPLEHALMCVSSHVSSHASSHVSSPLNGEHSRTFTHKPYEAYFFKKYREFNIAEARL